MRELRLSALPGLALVVALAVVPARAEQTTATYSCEGKIRLTVTFDSDANTATVQSSDLGPLTMQAVPTGDGFHYKSGEYSLRGRGNEAAWQVGMNDPFPCIAEQ